MAKKENKEYANKNKNFLRRIATEQGIVELSGGVLYRVERSGQGDISPTLSDVVSVHYRGTLIDGQEFDSSLSNPYPETFRLRDVIEGWQVALCQMHIGDKWIIYIPSSMAYGKEKSEGIPKNSTLIFEVELIAIN